MFVSLYNSSALHYYHNDYNDNTKRLTTLLIINVTVMHNTGFGHLNMFHIVLNDFEVLNNTSKYNEIGFIAPILTTELGLFNCSFVRNTNIGSMLYVEPLSFSNQVYI